MKKLVLLGLSLVLGNLAIAQEYSQVLRGSVLDVETRAGIPGAIVQVHRIFDGELLATTTTDLDGKYRIEAVPVGMVRITAQVAFFHPYVREDVSITSAKEVIIDLPLDPTTVELSETEVRASPFRGEALNPMAPVSAVTITPEQTRKFAGSWDDPMRVITAYPGVVQQTSGFNDFTVRGNAPVGMLYRLEGVPIHNPNHFGEAGTSGGFVTQFSSEVLGASDFFSSAFPAEFGNATSAVFDFRFRNGNNQRKEHTIKASLFGLDIATEGPLSQNSQASYLANYRYSTLGLLSTFINIGGVRPQYQDLSFNINLPTAKGGTFRVFGVGGISNLSVGQRGADSTDLDLDGRRSRRQLGNDGGALGLAYFQSTSKRGYFHAAAALSGARYFDDAEYLEDDYTWSGRDFSRYTMGQASFTADYNVQFSNRHTNKTGVVFTHQNHGYRAGLYTLFLDAVDTLSQTAGSGAQFQAFTQSKFTLAPQLELTAGLNYLRFLLNGSQSLDPRLALTYRPETTTKVSLAYGHHSRVENLTVYYIQNPPGFEGQGLVNMDLGLLKAHHGVLNVTRMFTPALKVSAEAYYQYQYDVPVEIGGAYSVQNVYGQLPMVALENAGIGENYGVELLVHRFTKNGLYYLFSGSLFNARYQAGDGVWRNAEFNQGYSYNILVGKEYELKPKGDKKRIMGLNANFRHSGGSWRNPIDLEESQLYGWTRYDWTNPNSVQQEPLRNFDFTFTWQVIRAKRTGEFYVSIKNLYSNRAVINQEYDADTGGLDETQDYSTIPIIGYKVSF